MLFIFKKNTKEFLYFILIIKLNKVKFKLEIIYSWKNNEFHFSNYYFKKHSSDKITINNMIMFLLE